MLVKDRVLEKMRHLINKISSNLKFYWRDDLIRFAFITRILVCLLSMIITTIVMTIMNTQPTSSFLYRGLYFVDSRNLFKVVFRNYRLNDFARFAYLPGYPYLLWTLAFISRPIVSIVDINPTLFLILLSIFTNMIFFSLAARVVYELSLRVMCDDRLASLSAFLFCLNPSSVHFTVPATHGFFNLISFTALLLCENGMEIRGAVLFGLSGIVEWNGLLYATFFIFKYIASLTHQIVIVTVVRFSFILAIIILPYSAWQTAVYSLVCHLNPPKYTADGQYIDCSKWYIPPQYQVCSRLKYGCLGCFLTLENFYLLFFAIPVLAMVVWILRIYLKKNCCKQSERGRRPRKKRDSLINGNEAYSKQLREGFASGGKLLVDFGDRVYSKDMAVYVIHFVVIVVVSLFSQRFTSLSSFIFRQSPLPLWMIATAATTYKKRQPSTTTGMAYCLAKPIRNNLLRRNPVFLAFSEWRENKLMLNIILVLFIGYNIQEIYINTALYARIN